MRSLKRNQRDLWYALVIGSEPILDEYGNDTLEIQPIYSSPTLLRCNVSANVGEEAVEVFGAQTDYNRTVSLTGSCPLSEGCPVWFGKTPNEAATDNNYVVAKVADSKNAYLVALREVTPHD